MEPMRLVLGEETLATAHRGAPTQEQLLLLSDDLGADDRTEKSELDTT